MLNRLLPVAVILGVAASCTPVLKITRPTEPEATLGNVRTLSVDVSTNIGRAAENAIVTGLVLGELPLPVPVSDVMRERMMQRLKALGYTVCPAAPCGDGAMTVVMEESEVGTRAGGNGTIEANVRLRARVKVRQNDGVEAYDFSFWDHRSGRIEVVTRLVEASADTIANRFQRTLLPGKVSSKLPLEDGGPLTPGVNMLYSSNWDGAIAYFTDLTQKQPELGGAWYDLGVAWEAKGDWGQALAAYEQAAARDRKDIYLQAVRTARQMAPAPAPAADSAPVPVPIPIPVE